MSTPKLIDRQPETDAVLTEPLAEAVSWGVFFLNHDID